MKKRLWVIAVTILIMMVGFSQFTDGKQASVKRPLRAVATLYIHGHHADPGAMNFLMASAAWEDNDHFVVTATVSPKGKVHLSGKWPAGTKHPMVKVLFQNNRTRNYRLLRVWLHNVLVTLHHRYGIKRFNVVAHSLGNAAVMNYELANGHKRGLPRLHKYVAIAGNFDGIPGRHKHQHPNYTMADGLPHWRAPWFKYAYRHRSQFNMRQASILNIYGNLRNGTHSDGKILNASTKSLKPLIQGHIGHYETQEFVGKNVQHRHLRENPRVASRVNRFLFH
ncbi:hypothetical protein AYR62_05660 [Secundilactobacillus paracollinoides]|uniref:alpha/beta hydrolase n=1 Tax=Secundilactobacillus paracollinoides TaxID=240427 RepID=UPI00081A7F2E|nr:alpha/beta hydrolase [Secundilactobacillus paracollinoides]ANZ63627.1 hypothetical protein AYR62_05660 [Secundilactobacillus paracollinoides]